MKMVVVNGFPRSGKDTFVQKCLEVLDWRGSLVSTVDFVKKIAYECGWDGTKSPENRKFLSDLKDLLIRWDNVPFKKVREYRDEWVAKLKAWGYDGTEELVLFVMCREPAEIQKLKDAFDAVTVFVQRDEASQAVLSNMSDRGVMDFQYDVVIENNGTIDELGEGAVKFLEYIDAI